MRPLLLDDIKIVLAQMDGSRWPTGLSAARDSFVLLAGFAGALRRNELAALTIADLTWHPADRLHLRIRTSKTDQESADATIVLPYGRHAGTCPPCAALRWCRLLHAATQGRPALMRAVLATPAWPEQTHLYPHPNDPAPNDPAHGEAAPDPDPDPAAGQAAARGAVTGATRETLGCRAPVPQLPAGMPLLPGIRRGGTLAEAAVTGDALHAMVGRRRRGAGGPGRVPLAARRVRHHRAPRRRRPPRGPPPDPALQRRHGRALRPRPHPAGRQRRHHPRPLDPHGSPCAPTRRLTPTGRAHRGGIGLRAPGRPARRGRAGICGGVGAVLRLHQRH